MRTYLLCFVHTCTYSGIIVRLGYVCKYQGQIVMVVQVVLTMLLLGGVQVPLQG